MKDIILLTNYYPYYKGEEYLESEIPVLSKKFRKIFLVSCMIDDNQTQTRPVPDNVIVIPSGIDHKLAGRFSMLINSINSRTNEKRNMNFSQKLYSKYFESRSMMISEKVINTFHDKTFDTSRVSAIYSYWTYITARVGIELKKNLEFDVEPKMITRSHRYDLYEEYAPLRFLPQRELIFEKYDKILPVSKNGAEAITKFYPEFKNKIEVSYLGTKKPSMSYKVTNRPFNLVSCSGVRPVKRLDLIIEALSKVQDQGYDFHWTHFGDGPDFKKINELASKMLDESSFTFSGFVPNHELISRYKKIAASVFINVSESEGLPVSIMEAMSMGIPVIATDVGGTSEIVDSSVGQLAKSNITAIELSQIIIDFINLSQPEFAEMSNNSKKRWENSFDAEKNYNKFANKLAE